jgi:hypothetical protein
MGQLQVGGVPTAAWPTVCRIAYVMLGGQRLHLRHVGRAKATPHQPVTRCHHCLVKSSACWACQAKDSHIITPCIVAP